MQKSTLLKEKMVLSVIFIELKCRWLHNGLTDLNKHQTLESLLRVLEKKIFKGVYHTWAWPPSWSCDLDSLYRLWFPLPKDAPHKIWL